MGGLPDGMTFIPEASKSYSYPSQFGVASCVYSQLQWKKKCQEAPQWVAWVPHLFLPAPTVKALLPPPADEGQ